MWRIHILDTALLYCTRLLANTNVMFFPVLEIRDNLFGTDLRKPLGVEMIPCRRKPLRRTRTLHNPAQTQV
jgi:hypothetical protein